MSIMQDHVSMVAYQELERRHFQDQEDAARAAARLLLELCSKHTFGSGEPFGNAQHYIGLLAAEMGLMPERGKPNNRRVLSKSTTRAVWDRDKWTCQNCGTHEDLSVDHILAIVNGGTDDMDNLQTLCRSCNSSKGAR